MQCMVWSPLGSTMQQRHIMHVCIAHRQAGRSGQQNSQHPQQHAGVHESVADTQCKTMHKPPRHSTQTYTPSRCQCPKCGFQTQAHGTESSGPTSVTSTRLLPTPARTAASALPCCFGKRVLTALQLAPLPRCRSLAVPGPIIRACPTPSVPVPCLGPLTPAAAIAPEGLGTGTARLQASVGRPNRSCLVAHAVLRRGAAAG